VVETVVGCKWSITIVDLVGRGILRPGAMERYGVLDKQSFPEVPPRVEASLALAKQHAAAKNGSL
jgi:hypothetical protein